MKLLLMQIRHALPRVPKSVGQSELSVLGWVLWLAKVPLTKALAAVFLFCAFRVAFDFAVYAVFLAPTASAGN